MLLLRLRHSLRSLVNRLRYLFSSFFCGFEHIGLRCLPSLIGFWSWRRFVFMLLILILLVLIYLDLIPVSKFEVFLKCSYIFWLYYGFLNKKGVQTEFKPLLNLNRTSPNLNRKFGSRFGSLPEPNRKFGSRFGKMPVWTGLNRTSAALLGKGYHTTTTVLRLQTMHNSDRRQSCRFA